MRQAKIVFTLLALLLLISGCGTKRQYFEPEVLSGKISYDGSLPAPIHDALRAGATLENGQVITKEGLLNVKLPQGFSYLADNQGRYVATSKCGALKIIDAADEALLSQWAYGDVDDDTVREWNKAFSKFKETAQELKDLAVKSVAKSKSDKALYIGVLRKEVAQYLEENKEKEEKSSK